MTSIAKMFVLALAVVGVMAIGTASGTTIPMEQAKYIHQVHLSEDADMPVTSQKGIQTAYDNICSNQERWIAKHLSMNDGWLESV